MLKILTGIAIATFGTLAQASGSASITCGSDKIPVLNVQYVTGADAGSPGLIWLGLLSPNQATGTVMTERGWESYQGGLYPFAARYDAGLPGVIYATYRLSSGEYSTANYAGYVVYVGHGAYTADAKSRVRDRRTVLDRMRATLVAAGRWNNENDSDERFIWSLIQKNMTEGQKYSPALTVPLINCAMDADVSG